MSKMFSPVLILVGLIFSSCFSVKPIYYEDDKAVARRKIEQLHDLYNKGDFPAIYQIITNRLKNETSEEQFVSSLMKLKETNGAFVESMEIDSQVIPNSSFREVRFKYSSRFEKGWCDEGFAIFVDGPNAIIDLLMINPSGDPTLPKR